MVIFSLPLSPSAICGENRFETKNGAFFKKAFDVRFAGNECTEHGKKYEPIAIAKFKKQTGAKMFFVKFMVHPEFKFLGGTFDGLAILPSGEGVLIEVKCPFSRGIGYSVPEHYVGQIQTYMEIAGLDRCLFVQYKPSYVTPGRKFVRPEKLSVLSVQRDWGYFVSRMPILWSFYKRLCAFREGVLPTANAAATAIQRTWRSTRTTTGQPSRLSAKLSVTEYSRQRRTYDGVSEAVEAEMERTQRPQMTLRAIPCTVTLVIVPDSVVAAESSTSLHFFFEASTKLVVCEDEKKEEDEKEEEEEEEEERALQLKRKSPDHLDENNGSTEKKSKQ
jgi:putative phage-type endonuclease